MSARLFEVAIAPQQCLACGVSTAPRDFVESLSSQAFEWGGHWYCNIGCFERIHGDRPVMVEYVRHVVQKEKDFDDLAAMMNGMSAGRAEEMMA